MIYLCSPTNPPEESEVATYMASSPEVAAKVWLSQTDPTHGAMTVFIYELDEEVISTGKGNISDLTMHEVTVEAGPLDPSILTGL